MSPSHAPSALPFRRYGWYVLAVFASLNFFNYANRNIILPVYDDLRATFAFSNAQLGLLTTVFMAPHALIALPAGWAGDRFDRRRVVAAGAALWGCGSLAVALATDANSILFGRAIAGVGTGALVPVANALLCDVFPDESKARTISVFNLGLFLGGAAGFGVGALAGFPLGVFIVALPPLALSVVVARLRVPARRAAIPDVAPLSWHGFARRAAGLLRIRTLRWLLLGAILVSFASGGYLAWLVDFVATDKGMTIESATLVFGVCAPTAGLAGVISGGVVADRLIRRVPYGRLAAVSIGLGCAVPFGLAAIYTDRGVAFVVCAWAMLFFMSWYHGPMAAVIDDLSPDDRAATAQAGILCVMHLLGTAPASYAVGVVADHVGLRTAMLVPTAAVVLAALAFAGGWRHVAADRAPVASR